MIEVRQARYFVAVAEELHFGRAAERLRMSQPPLSQAIKSLEQRLGVELLARSSRSVSLTGPGLVFLRHCRKLVDDAEQAAAAAQQASSGSLGRLRIGAVTTAFLDPLPDVMRLFQSSRPQVSVRAEEIDTHVGVRAVGDGELDVALVRQTTAPPGCRVEVLRRDPFVVAVPKAWDPVTLDALADRPWIWLPREISPDYHDQVAACCRQAGVSPNTQHTARSIASQLAMVACGLGAAIVPERGRHDAITYLRLPAPVVHAELTAIWRDDGDRLVAHFIDCATRGARGCTD